MRVWIGKDLGRYNLASNDKDWLVSVNIHGHDKLKTVSETFPEDEEPDIDQMPPSEVAEMLWKRLESYFYTSRLEKDREKFKAIREHAEELDDAWARSQIDQHKKEIEYLQQYMQDNNLSAV